MTVLDHLREIQTHKNIPPQHLDFLKRLRDEYRFEPKVIYDIGCCVLHWTKEAQAIWPEAQFYVADGFTEAEPLWQEAGQDYFGGVLSDTVKEIPFYVNPFLPGGNSYYKEIGGVKSSLHFPPESARIVTTSPLDQVRKEKGWLYPDLVKMDVQGAELDIVRGAKETLKYCKFLILELQHKPYNQGAPLAHEVILALEKEGWELFAPLFTVSEYDGDYCFMNVNHAEPT